MAGWQERNKRDWFRGVSECKGSKFVTALVELGLPGERSTRVLPILMSLDMLEHEKGKIRTKARHGGEDLLLHIDFREQETAGNDAGKFKQFVESNQQAFVVTVSNEL